MKDHRLTGFQHFDDVDFASFSAEEEFVADQEIDLVNFDLVFALLKAGQVLQVEIYSHFASLEFQNCPSSGHAGA